MPGVRLSFGPFALDPARRQLSVAGEPVALSERPFDVLLLLVARAGQVVSKRDLIDAGWKDVAVGDNSLEQAISALRRILGAPAAGSAYIETVPRRGYRFTAPVSQVASRGTDADLDALLRPHRAFVEGRAALETLEGGQVARARTVFESALAATPDSSAAHVGLANALVMQFEMTRADRARDLPALAGAAAHAQEACRLDPGSAEAWATLAFVLDRSGRHLDARAAASRATSLEPDNWRLQFRVAFVSWGEERLRAAHRALALVPGFPLAHWLAATVHVARQALDEAAREVERGLVVDTEASPRFNSVALDWLRGLLLLARGDAAGALTAFERELAREPAGQLYARECAANTWYAIGALRLRQGQSEDARMAFGQALERVTIHPLAQVGLAAAGGVPPAGVDIATLASREPSSVDEALAIAAHLAVTGRHDAAARTMDQALAAAPPGSAGWWLPLEPLLQVSVRPDVWAAPLARLRNGAA